MAEGRQRGALVNLLEATTTVSLGVLVSTFRMYSRNQSFQVDTWTLYSG